MLFCTYRSALKLSVTQKFAEAMVHQAALQVSSALLL